MQKNIRSIALMAIAVILGFVALTEPESKGALYSKATGTNREPDTAPLYDTGLQPGRTEEQVEKATSVKRTTTLESGDTLIELLLESGIEKSEAYTLSSALTSVFDPRDLAAGQELTLVTRQEDGGDGRRCLELLSFSPATDRLVTVEHDDHVSFSPRVESISHEARFVRRSGFIETSFYEAARSAGVPVSVLLSMFNVFSYALDFQRELRPGDSFEVAYSIYKDDVTNRRHPGELAFANLTVQGRAFRAYRYTTVEGYTGYFDATGKSLETNLMRTPIDGARLSSLFGKRPHPVLGYTRMHRGVDFAAASGTPILAAGDGTVVRRGRNGDFGRYIRIRHGEGYSTAYAHLSGYANELNIGDRVRQGDIIGLVGSSGLATGPNLHYEVMRNGRQIDPMTIASPPNRVLRNEEMAKFETEVTRLTTLLGSLDEAVSEMPEEDEREPERSKSL